MNLAIVSLVALLAAIALGYFRNLNVGLVSIALSMVLGLVFDISAKELLKGFSSSLFFQMAGITFLFGIVKANGTLELSANKIIRLVGTNPIVISVAIFLIGAVLSAIGPGAIPCLAIIPVIAIPIAVSVGINPIMLSCIGDLGVQATRMSPLTPEAIVVSKLMEEQGLNGSTIPLMIALAITCVILSVILFIYYKGYKPDPSCQKLEKETLPKLTFQQIISLFGLLALAVGVLFFSFNVGFAGFTIGMILILLGGGDDKAALKSIPWNVIFMVIGVGILMNIISISGGIDLMVAALEKVLSARTASCGMGILAGIMSFFSSGLGVVFPTLIPTAGDLAAGLGANPIEICAAIVIGGTVTGYSPISTTGALMMAGVAQQERAEERFPSKRIFIELFAVAFIALLVLAVLGLLGVYGFAVSLV